MKRGFLWGMYRKGARSFVGMKQKNKFMDARDRPNSRCTTEPVAD